jgi:hypothetical protein
MEMRQVASSNIRSVGYDADTQILRVEFHNGSAYEYRNVPLVVYEEFMGSSSLGAYLNRNLRHNYPYEKVG